ncbi:MAG: NADH:flavin oxidoreductase/NADH oxidase [Burkholderiales bacterium]|nr:NADH:flavin oxidoreductase/NADH oxidase [Burkholderiales bacterium]
MPSALFTPLRLRSLTLPNRIVVSPMCQYSARDGAATDWHLIHLGHLALGGAGLVMVEATAVEPRGRITPGCLGLWDDATEAALARVVRAIREWSGAALGIQLAHAGRKGSSREPWGGGALIPPAEGGWEPVAPSALPITPAEPAPRALRREELPALAEAFARAAERAARIGFDALELHCAHGYLLHEFLSPVANRRDDEFGGPLANRMRFPLEVFAAVRRAWPQDRPLGVRVSATDWVEGGWTLDDTVAFARALRELGCDWVDCSSGGVSPEQKVALGPGYQVPFAARVRAEAGIATMAVGLITEPREAEEIVASGKADLVALARGMLWNPRWAWHAAAALGAEVAAPRQYWRAPPRGAAGAFGKITQGQR